MPDEYPGSERHFEPNTASLAGEFTDRQPTQRVLAIRRAALKFANDYGPLPAANAGDELAQHELATRLFKACAEQGLKIIVNHVAE